MEKSGHGVGCGWHHMVLLQKRRARTQMQSPSHPTEHGGIYLHSAPRGPGMSPVLSALRPSGAQVPQVSVGGTGSPALLVMCFKWDSAPKAVTPAAGPELAPWPPHSPLVLRPGTPFWMGSYWSRPSSISGLLIALASNECWDLNPLSSRSSWSACRWARLPPNDPGVQRV